MIGSLSTCGSNLLSCLREGFSNCVDVIDASTHSKCPQVGWILIYASMELYARYSWVES